jgi:hypothetical protein
MSFFFDSNAISPVANSGSLRSKSNNSAGSKMMSRRHLEDVADRQSAGIMRAAC